MARKCCKMGVRLPPNGPVAQLGARLNGIQEVTGSIPVRSTILRSRALTPKRELRLGKPCEGGLLGLLRSRALTPKRELRLGKPCEESVLSNQHRLLREDTGHRAVR